MPTKKKVLIVTAVLIAVFLILEFGYFWTNLKFIFHKPQIVQTNQILAGQATQKMEPNILIIDSMDIKTPIIYVSEKSEQIYQAALVNGVVHFPGTALPGQPGNCYIFGHSSNYIWSKSKYKNIFAVLPQIQKGAEIAYTNWDFCYFWKWPNGNTWFKRAQ